MWYKFVYHVAMFVFVYSLKQKNTVFLKWWSLKFIFLRTFGVHLNFVIWVLFLLKRVNSLKFVGIYMAQKYSFFVSWDLYASHKYVYLTHSSAFCLVFKIKLERVKISVTMCCDIDEESNCRHITLVFVVSYCKPNRELPKVLWN